MALYRAHLSLLNKDRQEQMLCGLSVQFCSSSRLAISTSRSCQGRVGASPQCFSTQQCKQTCSLGLSIFEEPEIAETMHGETLWGNSTCIGKK